MACYIVACGLRSPGADTVQFEQALAALTEERWPCLATTWIVRAHLSAAELRDGLKPSLGPTDELLVAELTGQAAWRSASLTSANGLREFFGASV